MAADKDKPPDNQATPEDRTEAGASDTGGDVSTPPEKPPVTTDREADTAEPIRDEDEPETPAPSVTPTEEPQAAPEAPPPTEEPTVVAAAAAETAIPATPATPPARPRAGYGILGLVLAAIIGGVIATALGIAYHASGLVPTRAETAATTTAASVTALSDKVSGLDEKIAALETQPAAPSQADVTTLDSQIKTLGDKVSGLETAEGQATDRIGKLEAWQATAGDRGTTTQTAISGLDSRLSKLETAVTANATAASVTALAARVAALETTVQNLGPRLDALATAESGAANAERAARMVVTGAVRQAAASGEAFANDLTMLQGLGADDSLIAELQALAAEPVPTLSVLQSAFPAVADAILASASNAGSDMSIGDRLAEFGRGLVSIRPTTAVSGDTPEAIVSRMQAAVENGDLAKALDERRALSADGQQASAAWAAAANDRIKLDDLIAKLEPTATN